MEFHFLVFFPNISMVHTLKIFDKIIQFFAVIFIWYQHHWEDGTKLQKIDDGRF